ncbi:MAG: cell division protein SepF [Oscillospiraceae bacterium]|nr:cell division protein SepF [Oscillospiraceae bacterium]
MKNIWEKVKDFTGPYAAEDDYDDEYEDMEDGFEEEEAPRYTSRDRRENRRERRTAPVTETATEETEDSVPGFGVASGFSGHVVGSAPSNKQQLVLVRPETFNDATIIATNLRQKKAIVLNLDNVDKALARRVVDFLSGCTYAVDGSVKKVAHATYLFCPSNMEVTGDLQNLAGETEAYV